MNLTRRQVIGLSVLAGLAALCALARLLVDRDPIAGELSWAWPESDWLRFRVTATVAGSLVTGPQELVTTQS